MSPPRISVVVPAFNCEKTIAQCIESILLQSHPVDEVIIVDDGSTDKTSEIIQNFKNVIYLRQSNAGPAAARNLGESRASGELVFFTDSDCLADRNWILCLFKHFQEEGVAVVSGSYGISNPQFRLARCVHQEIIFRHQRLMPKYPKSFGSFNFGIKKDVFRQIGRFDETYRYASGEDNDLSYKVLKNGYKIYFEPESKVNHFHPTKLTKYLKEQFRHGFWRVKMYIHHPLMVKGDHYTFWKDMVEIPISLLILLFSFMGLINSFFVNLLIYLSVVLLLIEFYFSHLFLKNIKDSIYYGFVLFLRSFARTAGFSAGFIYFFLKKEKKKSN